MFCIDRWLFAEAISASSEGAGSLLTRFQQFIGTPAYISPEQAEMSGLDIDTRADIYSLGVLLYELLVGQTPFDAKEMMEGGLDALRQIIREKEPLRPSTRLNTLPGEARTTAGKRRQTDVGKLVHQLQGDLDWIVMKCLEKDRMRRYDTANGLSMDIERHLNDEAVFARPPSAAYRFQKLVRRNKLAFAAVSAVTLTLIAGLSFSTWAFLSEAAQRRTAVEQRTKAVRAQEAEKQERLRADAEKITAQRHLYVANMNLAQQAWGKNNIGRLRQLLEETRESPDRGFEWYYWQRQSHRALKTLRGHLQAVFSVAFSPDGQRIVTGSADQTAKVWQTARAEQVAAWQVEERTAAQYLDALQRARTAGPEPQRVARVGDEGAIKQWLILAPIAFATGQSAADAVDTEQIEGEGRLRPKAGEGAIMVSGELKWQEVAQEDYVIDFSVILPDLTTANQNVAYAVCYIRSEVEQRGLRMLVGSDDEAKVYLNGKLIYRYPVGRSFVQDQDTVPDIALNAGLNVLVFKVVNELVDWKGSIRFTDAQGNPVHGIKVTLDPEATEKMEIKQP